MQVHTESIFREESALGIEFIYVHVNPPSL